MTPAQKRAKARHFAKMRVEDMLATATILYEADYISLSEKTKLKYVKLELIGLVSMLQSTSRTVF